MSRHLRHLRGLPAGCPAIIGLLVGGIFATGPAEAAQQDPRVVAAAIDAVATASAPGANVSLGALQGAAFMPRCAGPLAVALSGVQPYQQAAVHCAAPAWTLYVTVTVAATQAVAVAARPIAAGQTLTPADVTLAAEPNTSFAGRQVFYDPGQLAGASPLMNLPAGAIITQNELNQPVVVQAGQTVSVDVHSGGLDVSINAIADQSGRLGDTILLTNPSSGKRFSARVTAAGLQVDF